MAMARLRLDGATYDPSFIDGTGLVFGVATDGAYLYWTNYGRNSIGRAGLDGTAVDQDFITGASLPIGLDAVAGHLYWTSAGTGTIGRAGLDGTGVNQAFASVGTYPVAVNGGRPVAPTVGIASPVSGRTFTQGQSVPTSFSCSGPGLRSCTDSRGVTGGSGALDTSTLGAGLSYTVTATSVNGLSTASTVSYSAVGAASTPSGSTPPGSTATGSTASGSVAAGPRMPARRSTLAASGVEPPVAAITAGLACIVVGGILAWAVRRRRVC